MAMILLINNDPLPEAQQRTDAYCAQAVSKIKQVANEISERDGVPWMNIEFFVRGEKDQLRDLGKIAMNEPIENYYKAGLASFERNASGASGFTVASWLGMRSIRGTKAVLLMKDFFSKLLKNDFRIVEWYKIVRCPEILEQEA